VDIGANKKGKIMGKRATWKPHEKHGDLTEHSDLPNSVFAFPQNRKEPLTDSSHVRNALARFDQVEDVNDEEREQAFANIKKAARHFGVEMSAKTWRELGKALVMISKLNREYVGISSLRRWRCCYKRCCSIAQASGSTSRWRGRNGSSQPSYRRATS